MEFSHAFYVVRVILLLLLLGGANAKLSSRYYEESCPDVNSIVYEVVKKAVSKEARMAGSLLRLHFHDCFVNGCDGSLLLDNSSTFTSEKYAGPNFYTCELLINFAGLRQLAELCEVEVEYKTPQNVSTVTTTYLSALQDFVTIGVVEHRNGYTFSCIYHC